MKREFSKHWKSSKQPRKQRKYRANAPLHIKQKMLKVNLSRELKSKYEKKNVVPKKDDTVRVMRGKFKGKQGKITSVFLRKQFVEVEGVQIKKLDGSNVNVKLRPSNLQLVEVNAEDNRRVKALNKDKKVREETKSTEKKIVKEENKNVSKKTKST